MFVAYFFCAAAGGFILLATVGIQALVALFSSIPLTRRRKAENPEFDDRRAYRRIAQVTVLVTALMVVITALLFYFASLSVKLGYLLGLASAFFCCLKRLSPNNELNRKNYAEAYADCAPPSAVNPDDVANSFLGEEPPAEPAETGDGAPDVSPAPPPGGEPIHWRDLK